MIYLIGISFDCNPIIVFVKVLGKGRQNHDKIINGMSSSLASINCSLSSRVCGQVQVDLVTGSITSLSNWCYL